MPEADDAEISYETARDELIGIVQKLEAGGIGLADALALWERGEKLADICQQWLDGARARLQAVSAIDASPDHESAEADSAASSPSSEPSDSNDT